jgi:hypothetical protein
MRILLFLILFTTGCATSHKPKWTAYNAGPFSFSMPADMQKTSAHGIDSYCAEFKNNNMTLVFDYGPYSNDFQDWPDSTSYEKTLINGQAATIGVARKSFGHPFPYEAQVSFENGPHRAYLAMFVSCRTSNDCIAAKRIFYSIKFEPKR